MYSNKEGSDANDGNIILQDETKKLKNSIKTFSI